MSSATDRDREVERRCQSGEAKAYTPGSIIAAYRKEVTAPLNARIAELEGALGIEAAIEDAAGNLPDGYMIEVTIENGYAGVTLVYPDLSEESIEADGDTDIAEQIAIAKALAGKGAGE